MYYKIGQWYKNRGYRDIPKICLVTNIKKYKRGKTDWCPRMCFGMIEILGAKNELECGFDAVSKVPILERMEKYAV
jgi:hypothetical protein